MASERCVSRGSVSKISRRVRHSSAQGLYCLLPVVFDTTGSVFGPVGQKSNVHFGVLPNKPRTRTYQPTDEALGHPAHLLVAASSLAPESTGPAFGST